LIAIPAFAETGEVVLVDSETLEVEVLKVEAFQKDDEDMT
jgi:DNA polymerase II small subunit/DNA polymerase delta subunit B